MDTILKSLLLLLVHQCVCQVCNETRSIFREVPETYRFSFIETYEEPCIIFCSVKTRKSVNVTTRMVQRFENVTVNTCCEGYVEDENHEGNGLYCEPVCYPPCQNGYCRSPNQCACEAGYALDPLDSHVCKPLCLEGCKIPDCISTKTPQCVSNNSTETITDRQSSLCTEPCIHSVCVGPECDAGYTMERSRYTNGRCVSPELCSCDPGWYKTEEGECKAHCDVNCKHGDCIAPNVCECHIGYQLYINKEISRCVPNRKDCEGSTSDPEVCNCEPPYEVKFFADNGGDCDCFGLCLNSSSTCTKATCLYMDVAFDMTPPELNYGHDLNEKAYENPGLEINLDEKSYEMSTLPTLEIDESTERFIADITPPELNYDYDSDDEEVDDQSYDVEVTPETNQTTEQKVSSDANNDSEVSTLTIIERDENTLITNTTINPEQLSNTELEKSDKLPDLLGTPDIKNDESNLYIERKEVPKGNNVAETKLNSNGSVGKREPLSMNWIIGVVVIVGLVILGIVVKQKCLKKHSLNLPGTNEEIGVYYANNIC